MKKNIIILSLLFIPLIAQASIFNTIQKWFNYDEPEQLGATVLFPSGGGLGTSTSPTAGNVPVGNANGTYNITTIGPESLSDNATTDEALLSYEATANTFEWMLVDGSGACSAGYVCTGGHTHVGVNETYGSGWDSDTATPEKDDVYDWGHLFDTDDDGKVNVLDGAIITPENIIYGNATSDEKCLTYEATANTFEWADCGTGGGGGGQWSTSTNLIYIDAGTSVLIGASATTAANYVFEVVGSSLFDDVNIGGTLTYASSTNWDLAYGWGNHASAGYLPITASSSFARWVDATTTNWNTAYSLVNASSSKWDSTYSIVNASSGNWNTAYGIVSASSTNWNKSYDWFNASATTHNTWVSWLAATSSNINTAYNWYVSSSSSHNTWVSWLAASSSNLNVGYNWYVSSSTLINQSVAWATSTAAKIGTLTNTKWCSSDGNKIDCTEDAPAGGGVTDLNTLSGSLVLWGTGNIITITASGTDGLVFDVPNNATSGTIWADANIPDSITITNNATTGTSWSNTNIASSTYWTNGVVPVYASSSKWDLTYGLVNASSSKWDSAWTWATSSLTYLNASSSNWNKAYGIVNASSTKWDTTYTIVNASSSKWDLTYSLVNASSSKWDTAYDQRVQGGQDAYIPVFTSATNIAATTTLKFCFSLENASDTDDNVPIWTPDANITIRKQYCRVQGGTNVAVIISDGTNAMETITCDADGQADDGSLTNNTYAANERIEFDVDSVSGAVTWLNFCNYYSID